MDKFQNKYRIPSARYPFWNYSQQAAYFITICTSSRENFFGDINNGQMYLNDLGNIVAQEWIKTVSIRPDMNLHLDEFVVMPNHFHAIIIIGDNRYNANNGNGGGDIVGRDAMHRVSTGSNTSNDHSLTNPINDDHPISSITTNNDSTAADPRIGNRFGPQSKNLASIVRGFKSAVTTQARKMGNQEFAWQPRFHDHIIRDDASFERIQSYIRNNPLNWRGDKFFTR